MKNSPMPPRKAPMSRGDKPLTSRVELRRVPLKSAPLGTGVGLQRTSTLKPGEGLSRKTPPKPSTPKPGSGIPDPLRVYVLTRDEARCVACGEPVRPGLYSLQHRLARSVGGTKQEPRPSELITLCGSATTGDHGFVETHPTWAREFGYRLRRNDDPEQVPIWWRGIEWRLLGDDGWREGKAA